MGWYCLNPLLYRGGAKPKSKGKAAPPLIKPDHNTRSDSKAPELSPRAMLREMMFPDAGHMAATILSVPRCVKTAIMCLPANRKAKPKASEKHAHLCRCGNVRGQPAESRITEHPSSMEHSVTVWNRVPPHSEFQSILFRFLLLRF